MSTQLTRRCATCQQDKPAIKFKRRLTLAETRSHNPDARFRMVVDSKNCTECRAKHKIPLSKKTAKELRELQTEGALTASKAELLIKRRKIQSKQAQLQAIDDSWEGRYALAWDIYLTTAYRHRKALQSARAYLNKLAKTNQPHANPALLDFYNAYQELVDATLAALKFIKQRGRNGHSPNNLPINPSTAKIRETYTPYATDPLLQHDWVRYVPTTQRRAVITEWEKLSVKDRARSLEPIALVWRQDGQS